jgi:hypothetical protein
VPHVIAPGDGNTVCDVPGIVVHTGSTSGIDRARARVRKLDAAHPARQVETI